MKTLAFISTMTAMLFLGSCNDVTEIRTQNELLSAQVDSLRMELERVRKIAEANAEEAYKQRKIAEEAAKEAKEAKRRATMATSP